MEIVYTEDNIAEVAKQLLEKASHNIFLFFAKMGVGKTTLIKELIKQLGCTDTVGSPTFSIVNEYRAEDLQIYHFDFYRLEDPSEAYDMGVEEYFETGDYVFIEWPEKISSLLPENATKVYLSKNDDGSRFLKIDN